MKGETFFFFLSPNITTSVCNSRRDLRMTSVKEKFLCLQPFKSLNDYEGSSCTAFTFTAHKMKSVEWLHMNFLTFENKQKRGGKEGTRQKNMSLMSCVRQMDYR